MRGKRGRPKAELVLSEEERRTLEGWARRRTTAHGLAVRSEIILACTTTKSNKGVARKLRVTAQTVGKWRRRFIAKRLDGLMDEPRPGAPRKITDDAVEAVVTRPLESTPKGATHWSTREMAKAAGLSHATVGRIWRAFGLQPHRAECVFRPCRSAIPAGVDHPFRSVPITDLGKAITRGGSPP